MPIKVSKSQINISTLLFQLSIVVLSVRILSLVHYKTKQKYFADFFSRGFFKFYEKRNVCEVHFLNSDHS